jgi:hypothetical protein
MTQKPMPEVASAAAATPNIRWAELLGTSYPGPERSVIQLSDRWNDNNWTMATPAVQVHCDAITCSRPSYFDYLGVAPTPAYNQWVPLFLLYRCRHCKQTEKLYAVLVRVVKLQSGVRERAIKLGEVPAYGPDLSAKLNPVLEPAREDFQRGQRAESQGLGLAAFHYYRRVLERQLPLILEETLKVTERIGGDPQWVSEIAVATQEPFAQALRRVIGRTPNLLRMGGHDPFALLETALQEGTQATTDEKCLELAETLRIILTDLAERIQRALKDHTEVFFAVKRLTANKPVART